MLRITSHLLWPDLATSRGFWSREHYLRNLGHVLRRWPSNSEPRTYRIQYSLPACSDFHKHLPSYFVVEYRYGVAVVIPKGQTEAFNIGALILLQYCKVYYWQGGEVLAIFAEVQCDNATCGHRQLASTAHVVAQGSVTKQTAATRYWRSRKLTECTCLCPGEWHTTGRAWVCPTTCNSQSTIHTYEHYFQKGLD